jgi:hypothetical protein
VQHWWHETILERYRRLRFDEHVPPLAHDDLAVLDDLESVVGSNSPPAWEHVLMLEAAAFIAGRTTCCVQDPFLDLGVRPPPLCGDGLFAGEPLEAAIMKVPEHLFATVVKFLIGNTIYNLQKDAYVARSIVDKATSLLRHHNCGVQPIPQDCLRKEILARQWTLDWILTPHPEGPLPLSPILELTIRVLWCLGWGWWWWSQQQLVGEGRGGKQVNFVGGVLC